MTLESYNWVLDRSFGELEKKGLETNPRKICEGDRSSLADILHRGRTLQKVAVVHLRGVPEVQRQLHNIGTSNRLASNFT